MTRARALLVWVVMKAQTPAKSAHVRERFLLDHEKVEDLLQQVWTAFSEGDRERVAAIWTLFDAQLLAHMEAEERFLVPILMRTNERAARAILEEHKHFRTRLVELGTEVDLHFIRSSTVKAFLEELRAHATHEDRVLYAWADQHVDEGRRSSLMASLVDSLKARLMARAGVL